MEAAKSRVWREDEGNGRISMEASRCAIATRPRVASRRVENSRHFDRSFPNH